MQNDENLRNIFTKFSHEFLELRDQHLSYHASFVELFNNIRIFIDEFNDDYLDYEPWLIFNAWLDHTFDSNAKYFNFFRAWQVFHWEPDPATVYKNVFDEKYRTLSDVYLKNNYEFLSTEQRFILKNRELQKIDIYKIVGIHNDYLILQGQIAQTKVMVYAPALTPSARVGEYIFAIIMIINNFNSSMVGYSQIFPQSCRDVVNDFCSFVERSKHHMPYNFRHIESDYFNLFYDIRKAYDRPSLSTK